MGASQEQTQHELRQTEPSTTILLRQGTTDNTSTAITVQEHMQHDKVCQALRYHQHKGITAKNTNNTTANTVATQDAPDGTTLQYYCKVLLLIFLLMLIVHLLVNFSVVILLLVILIKELTTHSL